MKPPKKTIFVLIIATLTLIVKQSCIKEDFDKPPINIPTVDFESNTTIAELKSMFTGDLDSITENIIIQGIVIANDESGNIFKTMYIRDHTAGIELKLDQTGLYNTFKLGQRVYVKCQGMFIGKYAGMQQLGYNFNNSIGRLPAILIPNHLFRDSLPGNKPQPTVTSISELTTAQLGTLIRLDNVFFEEPGLPFAESTTSANRILNDENGNSIIVRTSNFADFATSVLPAGAGSVVGILSIFNSDLQIYIRDLNDLVDFDPNAPIPQIIFGDNFDNPPTTTNWTIFSVASIRNWTYISTDRYMEVNGFNGDVPSDDWMISKAITLNSTVENPFLAFRTWTRFTDAGLANPLKVFISTDYSGSGDPATATWTELAATFPAAHSQVWTSSGQIDLSAYLGQTFYIGFQYKSSGTGSNTSAQWRLDNVEVKATF